MPTAPTSISVAEAMSRSDFYPGAPPVAVRETHSAWVFLAGRRAYKVKKPVRMAFLDFTTLARRRAVCCEEVRVNEELAASLEMRLRAVVVAPDGYALAAPDAPDAVEYAIEMRRFDERRTMAALLERGALRDEQVCEVGRRLAQFHARARALAPGDHVGDVRRAWHDNTRELFALVGADDAVARRVLALDRFAGAFLVNRRAPLQARSAAGCVRDCHGDLRAEHVVLEDPLAVVDRLEFDTRLREIDVADDLAFLLMDLERLGAREAARLLVEAYRENGGDAGGDELLSFYGTYRALVRVKVALLRAAQLAESTAASSARGQAGELLALAEHFAWRARGPLVLAISGPPASGKSTLATAVARRSGWPLLSSDVVRKRRRDLALTASAPPEDYTPQARAGVYRELGEQARACMQTAAGGAAIVDATFGDPRLRAAFLEGLGGPGAERLCAVECRASAALRDRWARARQAAGAYGSDADADVVARLGASFASWEDLPPQALLTLRTGIDPDGLVDQIADWLDTTARSARS